MAQKSALSALSEAYLPQIIEAFLASKAGAAWSPTRLGKTAVGDPNRVFQIRNGADVMSATAQKILAVIDAEVPGFTERAAKKLARENFHDE
jgi:hypothetical protein